MKSLRWNQHGLDTWRIASERWSVDLLLNKGADLSSLRHVEMGELLLHTRKGLALFEGRDLEKHPLTSYNELYFGGWQNLLPHRAMMGDRVIPVEDKNASCITWLPVSCEEREEVVCARLRGEMPGIGFSFERTLVLDDRKDEISIRDEAQNRGTETVVFPWTQHIAFGGDLCQPDTRLIFPDCRWLDLRDWKQNKAVPWQSCLRPLCQAEDADHVPFDPTVFPVRELHAYGLVTKFAARPSIDFQRKEHRMRFSWDQSCFPHIRYWAQKDADLVTVALEPSTSLFHTAQDAKAYEMAIRLDPGQKTEATIFLQYI